MVRLRPCGVGRFFVAGFLLFWLCGWAVGEGFAIWLLSRGALALINGTPLGRGQAPLATGPALAMGAFLILWLGLWTLGGVAAIAEFLRLTWGEDRLLAQGSGLTLIRARGPFRTRREFPRDRLRRILLAARFDALALDTDRERVELSRMGTRDEREAAVQTLRAELGLGAEASEKDPAVLPKGWQETITPEGERALVPDLAVRRSQARVAGVVGMGLVTIAAWVAVQAVSHPGLIPGAVITTLMGAAMLWGAAWLARGRTEWRIGSGRLTQRRRFGTHVRDTFTADRLEVVISNDSDGDNWFALEAIQEGARPQPVTGWRRVPDPTRRRIASVIHDPTVPRQIGAWLRQAANVPLEDRTTHEAREADLAALTQQLEHSGRFGKFLVRVVVNKMRTGASEGGSR